MKIMVGMIWMMSRSIIDMRAPIGARSMCRVSPRSAKRCCKKSKITNRGSCPLTPRLCIHYQICHIHGYIMPIKRHFDATLRVVHEAKIGNITDFREIERR